LLILRRAPIGDNQEDHDVLEDGVFVARIFLSPVAPQDRPRMWASGHNEQKCGARTREAAMNAFAKSWRGRERWRSDILREQPTMKPGMRSSASHYVCECEASTLMKKAKAAAPESNARIPIFR
jgi:hypothetical protein